MRREAGSVELSNKSEGIPWGQLTPGLMMPVQAGRGGAAGVPLWLLRDG